jgi:hypothetical protein
MGRLQVNGFDGEAHAYINLLKNWSSTPTTGDNYPADLNANGYPTTAPSTSISGTINPYPSTYTGNLVLKWTGTGTINIEHAVTISSGGGFVSGATTLRMIATGTNGRIVFTFNVVPSAATILFPSGQTHTNMSNVILCREDQEALIDAGEIFNPYFLDIITALDPNIIRPLGWSNPNDNNNLADDIYAWDVAAFSYHNNRWHPDLWAGDASGTDTYTVGAATATPAQWTDREIIQCRIPNANTSTTVTLNVNSRGAKTVKTMFLSAPSVGEIAANQLATFVYDAKSDFLLYRGGGLTSRVPVSIQVALANKTGKDLWINIPHLMIDAAVQRVAQYIKANLNPSLTCYIELSNEIWNFGGGFPQTSYAHAVGRDFIGFTDANNRTYHGWYAKRYREVMEIITDVWDGATSPRLQRVIAFQAFGVTASTNTYRLQGADLTLDVDGNYTTVAEDIVTNYTQSPNRPIDFCDVLSYATYWSGHNTFGFDASYTGALTDLLAAADDYDSGVEADMEAALDWLDTDLRGTSAAQQTLKRLNDNIYPGWETIAASYSKPVLAYEGGCEIKAPSTSRLTALEIDTDYSARIQALFDAYKADNRFKVTASAQMRQFMAQPSSHTPSWFWMIGNNQWSLRQGDTYDEEIWKSWDACVARTSGRESFSIKWAA